MRFPAQWLAIPSLLFALAPVHADDPSPSAPTVPTGTLTAPAPDEAGADPTGIDADSGKMNLSLDAAVEMALENNLAVEIQRFGPLIVAAWRRMNTIAKEIVIDAIHVFKIENIVHFRNQLNRIEVVYFGQS